MPRLHRLPLRRLSEAATGQLCAGRRIDARHVYAITAGNPYYVMELLATGDGGQVPHTIVDSVLARVTPPAAGRWSSGRAVRGRPQAG